MGQTTRRPSVWCSSIIFFFIKCCKILCKNPFNLSFDFLTKIKSFKCPNSIRNCEKKCEPAYYIVDCRIFKLFKVGLQVRICISRHAEYPALLINTEQDYPKQILTWGSTSKKDCTKSNLTHTIKIHYICKPCCFHKAIKNMHNKRTYS